MSKYSHLWQTITGGIRNLSGKNEVERRLIPDPPPKVLIIEPTDTLTRLREYLLLPDEPDSHLSPKWLAVKLQIGEREMLDALAYAVHNGLVELHWEVFCPECGARPAELGSLREAHSRMVCPACENIFDLHLDRDVRVTFSASERLRRTRGGKSFSAPLATAAETTTNGLDLLLSPMFRKLFSGEAPALDESLRIGRVAILFTDLRGSTAIYAERGDPRAYKMVREHFDILMTAIERHRGVLVKTIGDSVMASFTSGADAVAAAFEAQAVLQNRVTQIGGELVLKAGVHAGICLAVNLNGQLDFFGSAVNTAARVQGLSNGNDVVVTDEVFAEVANSGMKFAVSEQFLTELRGLNEPINAYRLV